MRAGPAIAAGPARGWKGRANRAGLLCVRVSPGAKPPECGFFPVLPADA